LVRRSDLPPGEVTAAMTTLVIKGLVAQRPGGLFAARSAPRAS
jgi:DNA-binding IclR family transcriptional regulator